MGRLERVWSYVENPEFLQSVFSSTQTEKNEFHGSIATHNLWINKYWSFIYLIDSRHHYSSVIVQDRSTIRLHNSDRMFEILFDHQIHMSHCSWTSHSKLKALDSRHYYRSVVLKDRHL